MTAPNFAALERLSAVWQVLATHQDLPALVDVGYVADRDTVHVGVPDADAADLYANALGIEGPEEKYRWSWSERTEVWSYIRYSKRFIIMARDLVDGPPGGVETAENSGPDRVAVV